MDWDRRITITEGESRKSVNWKPRILMLSELWERLRQPTRSTETMDEYRRYTTAKQSELKDIGGFVGGTLNGPRRKAESVIGRDVIALDLDNIPKYSVVVYLKRLEALGCGYCTHSTRKHTNEDPRLRVYLPLDRTVSSDEYEPIARKLAEYIGIEAIDPTTFDVARLMYWPSCCSDREYVYYWADKPFVSADGILAQYADWRDVTRWPSMPGIQAIKKRENIKPGVQGDPTAKGGVVGAFCRTYDIYRAIDELIPGVYEPVANADDRFTYVGGSTTGGAVVYDGGKFLYSHHATDPCGGRLVNAFDLVRLHRFGDLDDGALPNTPVNKLLSYTNMCQLATSNDDVLALMAAEDFADIDAEPAGENPGEPAAPIGTDSGQPAQINPDWVKQLTRDQNGVLHKSMNNITLLIQNAPGLRGCVRKDEFSGRIITPEKLPWRNAGGYWIDSDTTELRTFFETHYKGYKPAKGDVKDAVVASAIKQAFHPVRDYLNKLVWDGMPRLDTLFIDYLGVEDSKYARTVTRKSLVGAVARVMNPGCKFDYMIVFVGKQEKAKSSIISKLAIKENDWYTGSLATFDGKNAYEAVSGKWLVEIPEMHAFDKTTMNQAKAFITTQSDYYRAAYAEFPEDHKRQCVFFGTTNTADCLRDETGGRRYWPLDIDIVERKKNPFDDLPNERDQIWAEAVCYWRFGEVLYLTPELSKIANEVQEEHREMHPWEYTVRNFVESDVPEGWEKWDANKRNLFYRNALGESVKLVKRKAVCIKEIWIEALEAPFANIDQSKSRVIAGVLRRIADEGGWKYGNVRSADIYDQQKGIKRIN